MKNNNLPQKTVLLDNATSHPNEDELQDGETKGLIFVSKRNILCQPMNQGALETLKRKYRRNLLSSLIDAMDKGEDMVEKLLRNLKDVAYYVSQSWESVTARTIAKS